MRTSLLGLIASACFGLAGCGDDAGPAPQGDGPAADVGQDKPDVSRPTDAGPIDEGSTACEAGTIECGQFCCAASEYCCPPAGPLAKTCAASSLDCP